jgi:hypothetical protein
MHRLQRKAGYSAIRYGALAILALLASQATGLAQSGAAPSTPAAEGPRIPDCASKRAAQSVTDAAVTLNPSRGWQMVGREIQVTITSTDLPAADPKPVVCFGWKFKDAGKRNYVRPVDAVRIVPQAPATPPSLTLAVTVPSAEKLGDLVPGKYKPDRNVVEYSALDNYAPIAEVRILMFGRDGGLLDVITTVAVVNKEDYCNVPTGEGVRIGGGMIEPSTSKNWQPIGGEIEFTAKSATTFPSDAQINVCFRWKVTKGEHSVFNDSDHIRFLDFKPNTVPSAMKLAVGVPLIRDDDPPSRGWFPSKGDDRIGSYAVLGLIPEADVRTLVFDKDLNLLFDNASKIGVTSRFLAVLLALFVLVIAFVLLYLVSRKLFPDVRNPLLAVITTPRGFASLSQFQIMLWTFVVMTASVYVIALAGDLIVITPGTLILLGISGATVVLAKVKQPQPTAPAAPPPPPAAPPAEQPAQAGGATRRPRWSDLVTDEKKGEELDVTRIQMLLFTLVTATFVAIKVITSYEIPDIPDGFLILMGISNGVYVGSKFVPPA